MMKRKTTTHSLRRAARTTLTLLMAALLTGCNDNNCPLTTISYAHFDFYGSTSQGAVAWTNAMTVAGYPMADEQLADTIYNAEPSLSSLSLPLSYTDGTTFVLHYTELMQDVITVKHHNVPYVSDIDCGTMMFYQVESIDYTTNAIDSIVVKNADINNEEKQNFIIYFRQ
jgi:hypothetical protein